MLFSILFGNSHILIRDSKIYISYTINKSLNLCWSRSSTNGFSFWIVQGHID